jgi:hypothetical protein
MYCLYGNAFHLIALGIAGHDVIHLGGFMTVILEVDGKQLRFDLGVAAVLHNNDVIRTSLL